MLCDMNEKLIASRRTGHEFFKYTRPHLVFNHTETCNKCSSPSEPFLASQFSPHFVSSSIYTPCLR